MLIFFVVSQEQEYVIETLGKYSKSWGAGFHFKIPFFQKIVNKVTKKEQVLDSKPQPVITKDNVTVKIDSVVYYKVQDSKLYTYGAEKPIIALENLTATTLRNIIGSLTLEEALTSRDEINTKMEDILDKATDRWGIKVIRVEIKNIEPPTDIRNAMEKQLKADREKRATILEAEAHKEASITRAEGDKRAAILSAEGERDSKIARAEGEAKARLLRQQAEADSLKALKLANADSAVLELKRYEAMAQVANGQAVKIIVPTDMTTLVKNAVAINESVGLGDVTKAAVVPESPAKDDPCCDNFDIDK